MPGGLDLKESLIGATPMNHVLSIEIELKRNTRYLLPAIHIYHDALHERSFAHPMHPGNPISMPISI